eukprot:GHRR01015296.1.p1 GENE.GHRR01015296.1~~GHRR01015296.1.p1  ORF type:complete len:383 (+),score=106.09 GHRR01015296.1:506-1654(+)
MQPVLSNFAPKTWLFSRMVSASPIMRPRAGAPGLVVCDETMQQRIDRAKGYPYARPDTSYIFCNGAAYTFCDNSWVPPSKWNGSLEPLLQLQVTGPDGKTDKFGDVLRSQGVRSSIITNDHHLTPILAIGSNAGPEQLARKFPLDLFPDGVVVPVVQCVLRDFDVCYAPLISSYGSATATLKHSPGTDVSVFVTYLTPILQQRMHETEGAYTLCKLEHVELLEGLSLQQHMKGLQPVSVQASVYQYNHQDGTLHLPFSNPGKSPVALAEIQAAGRQYPALTQVEMQLALRAALKEVSTAELHHNKAEVAELHTLPSMQHAEPGEEHQHSGQEGIDEWIMSNLDQPTLRRARVTALTKAAKPFQFQHCEVLMVIGTSLSTSVK